VLWGDAADDNDLSEGRQQRIRLGDDDLHDGSEEDLVGTSRGQ
jgi:hypothetical protein